jgi:methionine--tRNA ligase beta chain
MAAEAFGSGSAAIADSILGKLEQATGEEAVDPEDPWPELTASRLTRRSRCNATHDCGYVLTAPFERDCPVCGFREGAPATQEARFELPPLAEVLKVLAEAKAATAAKKAGGGKGQAKGGKGGKGAAKGAAKGGQPKKGGAAKGGKQQEVVPDVQKAQFRVGKIVSVKDHPKADKLFHLAVDVGEEQPRSVCAGLKNFFKAEELQDLMVVTIVNLKPAKMVGVDSQAMVLAGDEEKDGGQIVRPLVPPPGAKAGDLVTVEGDPARESWPKVLSSTIWKRVVGDLKVADGKATYAGKALVAGDAGVTVPDLSSGAGIH